LVAGPWAVKREKEGCCEAAAQFQISEKLHKKNQRREKKLERNEKGRSCRIIFEIFILIQNNFKVCKNFGSSFHSK
jgi:hypothetical protein